MHAARLHRVATIDDRPLRIEETEEPVVAPDEVLIDVSACGVCRTDLQIVEGDISARMLPITPGHQAVGRIRSVGGAVTTWAPGDRVGVAWMGSACGTCRFCLSGSENLCEEARFTGWDRDGGFAGVMSARDGWVVPIPEDLDDVGAAPLLCGGVIGYRSLRISGVGPGERLGLYGFGASATLAIQVAVHWGCEVFVVTRSEQERRRALELGAVWAGDYDQTPPSRLDAAVTFAPAGEVVIAALSALDRGGVVAINAIHLDQIPRFDYDLLWWERQIRSVANFTRRDAIEFLALAADVPIRTTVDVYPLEQANAALADLKAGRVSGAAVLTI